jgi:hypothetical protein
LFARLDGKRQNVTHNPKEDWLVVKNTHPAFVSRELFERVQRRLTERIDRPYQSAGLGLSGLVFCGHCGGSMSTAPYRRRHQGNTFFYRKLYCRTHQWAGLSVCRSRVTDEPTLLEFVVKTLRNRVIDEKIEERLRHRLQAELGAGFKRGAATRNRLRKEIAKLEKMIDRGTENLLLASPGQAHRALEKLSAWELKRDAAVARLARIEAGKPYNIKRLTAETMQLVGRLRFGLAGRDPALLHHTVQLLVERITLWFETNSRTRARYIVSKGVMVVREPSFDSGYIERTIEFAGSDVTNDRPQSKLGCGFRPMKSLPRSKFKSLWQPSGIPDIRGVRSHQNQQATIPPHVG